MTAIYRLVAPSRARAEHPIETIEVAVAPSDQTPHLKASVLTSLLPQPPFNVRAADWQSAVRS